MAFKKKSRRHNVKREDPRLLAKESFKFYSLCAYNFTAQKYSAKKPIRKYFTELLCVAIVPRRSRRRLQVKALHTTHTPLYTINIYMHIHTYSHIYIIHSSEKLFIALYVVYLYSMSSDKSLLSLWDRVDLGFVYIVPLCYFGSE